MAEMPDHPDARSDGVTGRAVFVVLDQALSSLTNFGLSLVVLRAVTSAAFGAFTVAMTAYFCSLGVCRALCGEPHVVRNSHVDGVVCRERAQEATGTALAVGAGAGIVLLAVAWALKGPVGEALVPLALVLPGLLLQDTWRYVFFSAGTPARAFANDLVWTVLEIGMVGLLVLKDSSNVGLFILAWGGAGAAAALYGVLQLRLVPNPTRSRSWLYRQRDLAPRFAGEFLVGYGAAQMMFLLIAATSGLVAVGVLNAARVVLGPFNILLLGVLGFAVPEGVRIWHRSPIRLAYQVRALGILLAFIALACAAVILAVPTSYAAELFGPTWQEARSILPFMAVLLAAVGAAEGPRVGLRVLQDSRRSLAARTFMAPLIVLGGVGGAILNGAAGAAFGLAIAHCVAAAFWWRQFAVGNRAAMTALETEAAGHP